MWINKQKLDALVEKAVNSKLRDASNKIEYDMSSKYDWLLRRLDEIKSEAMIDMLVKRINDKQLRRK